MSASREKKSRQNRAGEELTEKQVKAQQEAAQAKRNSIIYTVLGVVSAVLVAALLIWNSGFFQGRTKALTVNGQTYTVDEVQYYYDQLYNQYYLMAQYGMQSDFDIEKAPQDQMYDEAESVTWHDHILDEAIDMMAQVKLLTAQAEAAGMTLSHDAEHNIEHSMEDLVSASARNGFSTVNAYLKALYGRTMNKAKYEQYLRESALASEYQMQYMDKFEFTEQDLEDYYAEHAGELDLYRYNYAYFSGTPTATKDEDGNAVEPTEEQEKQAMEDAMKKAEALQAKLKSGTSFAAAMEQYANDTKVADYADQRTDGASLSSAFAEWMMAEGRKANEVTLVTNTDGTGYYVVQYLGRSRDTEVTGDVRHILVAAEQDEGAKEPTEAQYDAAKAKAEALLEQWKNGAATEESFAELAKTESADPGSASNGGLYEQVSSQTSFITEFANWVIDPDRKAGDTGLVKNTESSTKGWHILYFVGQNKALWELGAETALKDEAMTAWLDSVVEAAEVVELEGISSVG